MLAASASHDESVGLGAGDAVTLKGIRSRPELDGTTIVITGYGKAKERWHVELDITLETKLFKETNLVVTTTRAGGPPSESENSESSS